MAFSAGMEAPSGFGKRRHWFAARDETLHLKLLYLPWTKGYR
jgi:hypothetical protein